MLPVPRHRPRQSRRQVGRRGEAEQARGLGDVVHAAVRQEVEPAARQRSRCFRRGGSRSPSPATTRAAESGMDPGGSLVPSAWAIALANSPIHTDSLTGEVGALADGRASLPAEDQCLGHVVDVDRMQPGLPAPDGPEAMAEDRLEERKKMDVPGPVDKSRPGDDHGKQLRHRRRTSVSASALACS